MPATRSGKTRATMERALVAERVLNETRMSGKKLAKERLEEYGELFTQVAAHWQKAVWPKMQKPADPKKPLSEFERLALDQFERWGLNACDVFKDLAKFQSPTFKAVAVVEQSEQHRRFGGNARERLRHMIETTVLAEIVETVDEDGGEANGDVPVLVTNGGDRSS